MISRTYLVFLVFVTAVATVPPLGAQPLMLDETISGSWFDPSHDGEGWKIEILDDAAAVIYWITYDDAGNQAWNAGVGETKRALND